MPKDLKRYPSTKKQVKATSHGKTLSKSAVKSYSKLGKLGNKMDKKQNVAGMGRILEGPEGGRFTSSGRKKRES